jgi:hypothetical protein
MYYNLIQIVPGWPNRGEWVVKIQERDGDRKASTTFPDAKLGFMYYPRRMKEQKAFQMLKDSMIEIHEKELKRVQESLDKLKQLTLEG